MSVPVGSGLRKVQRGGPRANSSALLIVATLGFPLPSRLLMRAGPCFSLDATWAMAADCCSSHEIEGPLRDF